jgi:hypothetical protein
MPCSNCESVVAPINVSSPAQLKRLAERVRTLILNGTLTPDNLEADMDLGSQPPFLSLDLSETFPDFIQYAFRCKACSERFKLTVETYHGRGGSWHIA